MRSRFSMLKRPGGFLSPVSSAVFADSRVERGGRPVDRFIRGERVVISRALTHFELVTRPPGAISPRTMKAAQMAAQARTPFRDAEVYLVWGKTQVGVWSWSRSALQDFAGSEYRAIPETVLHAPADGLVLRACLDGFEGQLWQDSELLASRWWPYQPAEDEWTAFVRGLKGEHATAAPVPMRAAQVRPSQPPAYRLLELVQRPARKDIVTLAIIVLGAPILFLGGESLNLQASIFRASNELASLQNVTGEVVEARAQARYGASQIAAYSETLQKPHPMELLAVFAEAAADAETQLERANITDTRLEMVLQSSEALSPAALVELLENHPSLSRVRFAPLGQQNLWRVEADVEGTRR
ncbi:MAG: hypothetical protein ACXIVL_06445 [Oceanicaulis sp.]